MLLSCWWISCPRHLSQDDGEAAPGPPRFFLAIPDCRCDLDPPFLVLLVTSRQEEGSARAAIRDTWGAERRTRAGRMRAFFLLGYAGAFQQQIRRESQSHRDIIQGNFTDVYYNLTLKVLMGLEWVHRFCPGARFVMKTDSDMFVNTFYLTHLLKDKVAAGFFSGQLMHDIRPVQDKSSKWYVSKEEFALPTYPHYCSGTGYVFSGDLAGKIWHVSGDVPLLKLEDAYVGLCLSRLGISPVRMTARRVFFTRKVPFAVCRYRTLVTSHRVSPSELRGFWKSLEGGGRECPPETSAQ
ncbi:hypothetical protein scyTo_0026847 [Scyliorhinus torazame]|uniref:Hexosyltransferase n=1 Tax=Scyliorhinus torazame TaxID=75743 RepID=A0A401QLM2_SCYTO|nr:hypothetical protein [Scyliorhinus torazame]